MVHCMCTCMWIRAWREWRVCTGPPFLCQADRNRFWRSRPSVNDVVWHTEEWKTVSQEQPQHESGAESMTADAKPCSCKTIVRFQKLVRSLCRQHSRAWQTVKFVTKVGNLIKLPTAKKAASHLMGRQCHYAFLKPLWLNLVDKVGEMLIINILLHLLLKSINKNCSM